MGLDAAVYRDDDEEEKIASVRLGNAALIGHLLETVQQVTPTASILLTRVLYSGSHSGDSLPLENVREAKRELEEVAARLPGDRDVQAFVVDFGALLDVALRHERPITF